MKILASKWTDTLNSAVYERLCNCRSRKSDIKELVQARWAWMKRTGKDKQGFTKEDALVDVLDLLDSNNQYTDLTRDEWDDILQSVI